MQVQVCRCTGVQVCRCAGAGAGTDEGSSMGGGLRKAVYSSMLHIPYLANPKPVVVCVYRMLRKNKREAQSSSTVHDIKETFDNAIIASIFVFLLM